MSAPEFPLTPIFDALSAEWRAGWRPSYGDPEPAPNHDEPQPEEQP